MSEPPKIDLYCLCWNEARIIPFFLRHYMPLVRRVHVFDNGSTDGSVAMLNGEARVQVMHFDYEGDSFVRQEQELSEVMWRTSRGRADWVAVVDMDEHIHHPDLHVHLHACRSQGVTAIQAMGYEMVSDEFPPEGAVLNRSVTRGFRYPAGLDKLCLFDPNAITHSRYRPGRHQADPEGQVVWDESFSVKLLHYKKLGLDYLTARTQELLTGLRPGDIQGGFAQHYQRTPAQIAEEFGFHRTLAKPVPGLEGTAQDSEVHLMVRGERIDPMHAAGNDFRFALPAGSRSLRILSRCASPVTPRLGISVERLMLRGRRRRHEIPLDSPALSDGWWAMTRDEERLSRWTNGDALVLLPPSIPDPCVLEVRVNGTSLALVR